MQAETERVVLVKRAAGPPLKVPDWTLVDVVRRNAREHGDLPAFLRADGTVELSWRELDARIGRVAQGLLALGLRPGERVAVVSETRPEWVVADLAILAAGGVSVSAFPTLSAEVLGEALARSRVRFAFVEDADVLEKAFAAPGAERVEAWMTLDPQSDGGVRTLEKIEARGDEVGSAAKAQLEARVAALRPDDPAVILYTSGTTGRPKGVVLTHRNLLANSLASIEHLGLRPHPIGLAFLPLAHSYQRQSSVVLALLAGSVAFSAPRRLQQDLPRVRPTLLPAVPRLYERMHARIREKAAAQLPHRRRVYAWAERVAMDVGRHALRGEPLPPPLRWRHTVFDRLVYRRIRREAGLDRLDLAITGAASMREDLLAFFRGVGIRIVEGYGLTETAAPSTVNPPTAPRAGSVGTPLPGTEVAIAQDGEVFLRGPHVLVGYDGLPDDTREAFLDDDGGRWLRTGDLGDLDAEGYLRILDRKKELEVLDTGKNVAPLPIEERLKGSEFVADALVVAHGRKFVGCLIQPDYEALLAWAREAGVPHDPARTREGAGPTGEAQVLAVDPDLVRRPEARALFAREVERANAHFAKHEQVKAFVLIANGLSLEAGELTPTLKKRRRVILETRRGDVDALFPAK